MYDKFKTYIPRVMMTPLFFYFPQHKEITVLPHNSPKAITPHLIQINIQHCLHGKSKNIHIQFTARRTNIKYLILTKTHLIAFR